MASLAAWVEKTARDPRWWPWTVALIFCAVWAWLFFGGRWLPLWIYGPIPYFAVGCGLLVVMVLWPWRAALAELALRGRPRTVFVTYTLGATATVLLYGDATLGFSPHAVDEMDYLIQARLFAAGKLWGDTAGVSDPFGFVFMLDDGARRLALFQPLWPLLLAGFVKLGFMYMAAPLCAGLSVGLVYLIGRRTLGEGPARLGALTFAMSPSFLALSGTYLAHPLACVLTLAAFHGAVWGYQDRRWGPWLWAGMAMGLLFCTRATNAIALGAVLGPLALAGLAQARCGRGAVVALILGFLAASAPQFTYNHLVTGSATRFPQDDYFDLTEPRRDCHRPGFGWDVGCPLVHPHDNFPDGFGFFDAVEVTRRRLTTAAKTTFGWEPFMLLALLALVRTSTSRWRYALFGVFASLTLAYFPFYFHGLWGRYVYEATPFLHLLFARGIFDVAEAWRGESAPPTSSVPAALHPPLGNDANLPAEALTSVMGPAPSVGGTGSSEFSLWRIASALGPGLAVGWLLFMVGFFIPMFAGAVGEGLFGSSDRLQREVRRWGLLEGPPRAMVFVPPRKFADAVWLNDFSDIPNAPTWFVISLDAADEALKQRFPERRPYVWDEVSGQLMPDPRLPTPGVQTWAAVSAYPRLRAVGGFAYPRQITPETAPAGATPADKGMLEFENAAGRDAFFLARWHVNAPGLYRVTGRFMARPEGGPYELRLNGTALSPPIIATADERRFFQWRADMPLALPAGALEIRFHSLRKDYQPDGFGVVSLTLTREGELSPDIAAQLAPAPPLPKPMGQWILDDVRRGGRDGRLFAELRTDAPPEAGDRMPWLPPLGPHVAADRMSPLLGELRDLWNRYRIYWTLHFAIFGLLALPLFLFTPRGWRRISAIGLSWAMIGVLWGFDWLAGLLVFVGIYHGAVAFAARRATRDPARQWLWSTLPLLGILAIYAVLIGRETWLKAVTPRAEFEAWVVSGEIRLMHLAGPAYMLFRLIHLALERVAGRIPAQTLGETLGYLTFFPTFRMGPIERFPDFARDWRDTERGVEGIRTAEDLREGLWLIGLGAFKAFWFEMWFGRYFRAETWELLAQGGPWGLLWGGAQGVFAVYLDFGGYTDMARGFARLWGMRCQPNFVAPFAAADLGELWRRWHMTLSFWLRDHVFLPLAGAWPRAVPAWLLVTFVVCGLWHALEARYALWGLLQGVGLIVARGWKQWGRHALADPGRAGHGVFVWLREHPRLAHGIGVVLTVGYFSFTAPLFAFDWNQSVPVLLSMATLGWYPATRWP